MSKKIRLIALVLSMALVVGMMAGCSKEDAGARDTLTVAYRNEPANMDPTGSSSLTAFCIQFQDLRPIASQFFRHPSETFTQNSHIH